MTPEDLAYWSRGDVWATFISTWVILTVLATWVAYKVTG